MRDEKNAPIYQEEIKEFPQQTTFNTDDMNEIVKNEEEE